MKVGTDGVLLGAWAQGAPGFSKALDVGTGTGLIALMLAQRFPGAVIDAVEMDPQAAGEAIENFRNSPWFDRLNLVHADFRRFARSARPDYDLIVSNPPYFRNSLHSHSRSRTLARHSEGLSAYDLIECSHNMLSPEGRLCIIVPSGGDELKQVLSKGLFLRNKLQIRPSPVKDVSRVMMEFSIQPGEKKEDELVIESGKRHDYSEKYRNLTRDFYLDF